MSSAIGVLDDIAFAVATQVVDGIEKRYSNSINELKRSRSWKYAEHEIVKGKSRLQRLGRQLDTVSFNGKFLDSFCNPLEEMEGLIKKAESGKSLVLVFGEESFGEFVIESISETWRETDGSGNPKVIEFEVTLKEYN